MSANQKISPEEAMGLWKMLWPELSPQSAQVAPSNVAVGQAAGSVSVAPASSSTATPASSMFPGLAAALSAGYEPAAPANTLSASMRFPDLAAALSAGHEPAAAANTLSASMRFPDLAAALSAGHTPAPHATSLVQHMPAADASSRALEQMQSSLISRAAAAPAPAAVQSDQANELARLQALHAASQTNTVIASAPPPASTAGEEIDLEDLIMSQGQNLTLSQQYALMAQNGTLASKGASSSKQSGEDKSGKKAKGKTEFVDFDTFEQSVMTVVKAAGGQTKQDEEDNRFNGKIRDYNDVGGFGFIESDAAKRRYGVDVWIHRRQMFGFKAGDEISFMVARNQNGQPQARSVIKASEAPRIKAKKKQQEERQELQIRQKKADSFQAPKEIMSEEEARRFQASLKRKR